MKRFLWTSMALFFLSCSAPTYTYYFDKADYYAGRHKPSEIQNHLLENNPCIDKESVKRQGVNPLVIDPATLTASTDKHTVMVEESLKAYKEMTHSERKTFRKDVKRQWKTQLKNKRLSDKTSIEKTAVMDSDLKMAAIFGSVGLVFLLIGGNVFWVLGAIAMIVGVVFFVMWLSRQ